MQHFGAILAEAGRLTALGVVVHLPVPALASAAVLNEVHQRKIDESEAVRVVNPDGRVGASTAREVAYAELGSIPVSYTHDVASQTRVRTAFGGRTPSNCPGFPDCQRDYGHGHWSDGTVT